MAKTKKKTKQKQRKKEKTKEETKPLLEAPEEETRLLEGDEKADITELKKEIQDCQKLRDEYLAGWQRAKADFVNYKREEEERSKSTRNYTEQNCILNMLAVYENLEKAKEHIPSKLKENEWIQGILQIENQFKGILESYGLREIEAMGEQFDPNFHEAIEEIEKDEVEPGTVVEVIQKGYLVNNQLLRPAKVKVAK